MNKWYSVTFAGEYFVLTTSMIDADNQEQAIRLATSMLNDTYDWDLDAVSHEITAVLEGTH